MLSARPVGIDPRHCDPMLDEAMAPSPQVLPAVNCLVSCSAWDEDVWLTHGVSSVGSEESVDPMCLETKFLLSRPVGCSSSSDVHSLAHPILSSEEPLGFNAEHMMGAFDKPDVLVEVSNVVVEVAQAKAPPLSLENFLSKVTCAVPQPLLGSLTPLHREKDDGRRSGRLEKKNKACNILTAKRAEHRLLEAFGELPEVSKVEDAEQKMKTYLDMYIAALSTLAGIAGKSKMDLSGCFPHDNVSP